MADKEQMERIVALLWLDADEKGEFWNPDKDWDADTLAAIADVLEAHRPTEVKRVTEEG